jgi:hypothetical protein
MAPAQSSSAAGRFADLSRREDEIGAGLEVLRLQYSGLQPPEYGSKSDQARRGREHSVANGSGHPGPPGRLDHPGGHHITRRGASSTASGRTAACNPPFTAASPAVAGSADLALPAPTRVTDPSARSRGSAACSTDR